MDEKIPFDLELAKKILRGEIDGKFVTRSGNPARIITILEGSEFVGIYTPFPIIAIIIDSGSVECYTYTAEGNYYAEVGEEPRDLFIVLGESEKHSNPFISIKEKNILYSLMFGNPECKINGKKKRITGINRVNDTTFVCLDGMNEIEDLDNIELEGEI